MRRTTPHKTVVSALVAALAAACAETADPVAPQASPPTFGHVAGPSTTSKIAFVSERDGNLEVYVMEADGSNPTRLTHTGADELWPAWSPDGTRIAFASQRDGDWEIYVMDADGSNQTRLTHSSGTDGIPQWSPDGAKIAFYSHAGIRGHGHTEVYTMAPDGSGQTRVTFGSGWKYGAAWSGDGSLLAYRSDAGGRSRITVSNADGTGAHAITDLNWDESPDWSPDAGRIVFQGKPSPSTPTWDLYVVDADGSGRTQLTSTPGSNERWARWSSDDRILFSSDHGGDWEIWVMDADGSGLTRLTDSPGPDLYPDWSPELTPPNQAPTADAGPDAAWECSAGGAVVLLDGSGSFDPDGDPLTWTWSLGGAPIATGESATVTLPLGAHTVTLSVEDGQGGSDTDEVVILVRDTTEPELAFSLDVAELWPPNHRMVTVATGVGAHDACDPSPALAIQVTSNEPEDGAGDGDTSPDWALVDRGDGTFDVQLRAERSGGGSGRVYTITVTAEDASGNVATASGQVTVPHDRGRGGGKGKGKGGGDR